MPDKGFTASVVVKKLESQLNSSDTNKQDSVPLNDNIKVQTSTHGVDKAQGSIKVPGKGYNTSVRLDKIFVDPIRISWQDSLPLNEFLPEETGYNGSPMGERSPSGFMDFPGLGNSVGREVKIVSESKVSNGNETNVVIAKVTRINPTRKIRNPYYTRPLPRFTFQPIPKITINWENDNGYGRSGNASKSKSDDEELNF